MDSPKPTTGANPTAHHALECGGWHASPHIHQFWVTVGERGDLVAGQIKLLDALGAASLELRSVTQGLSQLREALADRRCLLVVDDVWSIAAAKAFGAVSTYGRVLYTTRDSTILHRIGADIERIGALSIDAARHMLATLTNTPELPPTADTVLEATGRVALAVALVGVAIAGGRSWQEVADQLAEVGDTFLAHPYANAFKAMQIGVAGSTTPTCRPTAPSPSTPRTR